MSRKRPATGGYVLAGALLLSGCAGSLDAPRFGTRAEVVRGAQALHQLGCGACHHVPGVAGAVGVVGPPLIDMGRRVYLSRGLPNSPDNMTRWIRTPQQFAPGSAMPDMQVSLADAQAITAFLYHSE
jgi:cytochrome c2